MNAQTEKFYAAVERCAIAFETFTVDDVLNAYYATNGDSPESLRPVGGALISGVFSGLIEDTGQWHDTGTGLTKYRGKPKRVWRSKVYEGASPATDGPSNDGRGR
jgi:hypothetical protein